MLARMTDDFDNAPEPRNLKAAQFAASVIFVSNLMSVAIGVILVRTGAVTPDTLPDSLTITVGGVLIPIGIALALATFPVRWILEAHMGEESGTLVQRVRAAIILQIMAETAGFAALGFAILSGKLGVSFLLWGFSVGAAIFHFPTAAWLDRAGPNAG
ncbi:MAG: hypothetical protein GWP08_12670 [Nitrospiraceae bacterium]|nr:hypothetical protein [Nitrospiraceae bacterium]